MTPLPRLPPLVDRFGRRHTYVRISVTDRCNFRCVYCMPEEGLSWMPRSELLSYEEIVQVMGVFAQMGVRKVRLTGGEPTLRADIESLIEGLAGIRGIDDIAMTTNGLTLDHPAPRLAAAARRGSTSPSTASMRNASCRLTRGGDLARVLRGSRPRGPPASRPSASTPWCSRARMKRIWTDSSIGPDSGRMTWNFASSNTCRSRPAGIAALLRPNCDGGSANGSR